MAITPNPHVTYSPEHSLGRQGPVYERLRAVWQAAGRAVPGAFWGVPGQQPRRPSPEARGAILAAPYGQPYRP